MRNEPSSRKRTHSVLVTGGCGYIGSHVTRQLLEAGHKVVVLDNLSTGYRRLLPQGATLVEGDYADSALVTRLIRDNAVTAVLHFAASALVTESVANPDRYYRNNVSGGLTFFEVCANSGIKNFIFSSTGSVYGDAAPMPAREDAPTVPTNPYSRSKLICEWMLRDIAGIAGMNYVILRYFNVAGADPVCRQGQISRPATHLVKIASEVVCGKRDVLHVFGTDYDTPDGTGVRDYVHVEDLASAHLAAMDYLAAGGASDTFNCGYGRGFSVFEVIKAVEAVTGAKMPVTISPRRPGDFATSVADNRKILKVLGWKPAYADLATIVRHALAWEKNLG